MNIRKSFCFFISVIFSLSIVIDGGIPPWTYLNSFFQELYIKNENLQIVYECEENVDNKDRFVNAFEQMQEQALERLRESRSGYLELPQQISTSDIVNSTLEEISQILNVCRNFELTESLCKLIKKCFPRKASKVWFSEIFNIDDRVLYFHAFSKMDRIRCKPYKDRILYFSVLSEQLEGKKPQLTIFVYNTKNSLIKLGGLKFLASLPLLEYPDPPEVKVEN